MYLTIKLTWYTQISTREANYNTGSLHPSHGITIQQVGRSIFCINTALYHHYYSLYINHNNFIGFQYLSFSVCLFYFIILLISEDIGIEVIFNITRMRKKRNFSKLQIVTILLFSQHN